MDAAMVAQRVARVASRFSSATERWRRYFDAQDLFQTAALAVWEYVSRNGGGPVPVKVMETIARNAIVSELRRARKWALHEVPLDDEIEGDEEED